jgi:hypothetical protein
MAMWDMVMPADLSGYNRPRDSVGNNACERCGREIPPATNRNGVQRRFCSELCRKRAERARWKAKWKARGVNKYIGGGVR